MDIIGKPKDAVHTAAAPHVASNADMFILITFLTIPNFMLHSMLNISVEQMRLTSSAFFAWGEFPFAPFTAGTPKIALRAAQVLEISRFETVVMVA